MMQKGTWLRACSLVEAECQLAPWNALKYKRGCETAPPFPFSAGPQPGSAAAAASLGYAARNLCRYSEAPRNPSIRVRGEAPASSRPTQKSKPPCSGERSSIPT